MRALLIRLVSGPDTQMRIALEALATIGEGLVVRLRDPRLR